MDPKKKKIYAGLIALGFIALVVDRLVLSEPSPAAASLAPSAHVGSSGSGVQDTGHDHHDTVAVITQAFPDSLSVQPAIQLRDAFQLTPSALESLRPAGTKDEANEDGVDGHAHKASPADFASRHRLEAVMRGASVHIAVLDGTWVNIGDVIDGWKLTDITGRAAVFENGKNRVELVVSTGSE